MKYSDVLKEEERNKEKVYSSFESELQQVRSSAKNAAEYYESGAYDDQDAFMAAGAMFGAFKAEQAKQKLVKALYDKPYFAHIRMHDTGDDVDCFLSDNENLDSTMMVLGNADMMIVPFKLDRNRPFLSAAFHCYQAKTDEVIPVEVYDRRSGKRYSYAYKPELIRDVDVFRRTINNVVTYLPNEEESDVLLEADELLAQKLEENRNNAKLRNIIATLQLQQFDIIRTDVETSFVVQGCAGSGKTQCLIHRLFFLRDTLQESGWNRVLLITPTQLFRNYSAELIRRYRLESVANISIAEFYKELLDSFDRRFSSRQYTFELSEEYLPDTYLQQVYSPFQIVKIDTEIDKAISSYVAAGCRLTGRSLPDGKTIDIDFVNELVLALSGLIEKYDETEKSLSEDREYQEHRKELDRLEKELRTLNRKAESYMDTRKRLAEEKDAFEKLSASYNSALSDVNEEEKKSEEQHDELLRKLKKVVADIDQCSKTAKLLPLMDSYTALRDVLIDRIELRSDEARFAAEYKALLSSILEGCNAALLSFTKNQPPKKCMERQERQIRTNEDRIHEISEDIELTNLFIEDHNNWLSEHNLEEAKNQRKAYRAELERARYFLSRIESSVFEQEVWNALAPLKTECGIETLFIEQLPNGRQKQNRILYKSDLLFYLRIYTKLHRKRAIPDYNLICIDEGQDLHSIDYMMLKDLYPNARLNVFGDTEQVLHESCGIKNWKEDTGIAKVYELNNNYRNAAAIADFCNKTFGSDMLYYGAIKKEQQPQMIMNAAQISKSLGQDTVVVVKNRDAYDDLCHKLENEPVTKRLMFIDTHATEVPKDVIPCYSIFAAKGLEFRSAVVYAKGMTKNQKIVACTRAMEELYYCAK